MRISEIHARLEAGQLLTGDAAFAALVAIEHLARLQGGPVAALNFAAPEFARAYPENREDLQGFRGGRAGYKAWRRIILDVQMRAAPSDTDDDPWSSLRRAWRLDSGRGCGGLIGLTHRLPAGTQPRDITTDLIFSIARTVAAPDRLRFRSAVSSFLLFFDSNLALQTGLLPAERPERLPGIRSHLLLAPMAPEILALRSRTRKPHRVAAIDYVNRLAVTGNRMNGITDTLDDLRNALVDLPSATDVGVPEVTSQTLHIYINRVFFVLGGRDPRLSVTQQAWAELRKAARAAGCKTSDLWALRKSAVANGFLPIDITREIALEIISSYRSASGPTECRRGCEQFDALHGVLPADLLPSAPLGIFRTPPKRRQPSPPPAPLPPVQQAWSDLYAEIKRRELIDNGFHALSFLKMRAIDDGLLPSEMTQAWVEQLQATCAQSNRSRLYRAVRQISNLTSLGLPDLTPLRTRKERHGGISVGLESELNTRVEKMGLGASTQRQTILAIGILRERANSHNVDCLSSLLDIDVSKIDWGKSVTQKKIHIARIRSLQTFWDLPWTSSWHELQAVVVATGMTISLNPVPKILSWKPAMEPHELNADWARRMDRKLRSTITNPPHGRGDLALTLSRQLARFDELHNIPGVAHTGLLPPVIGAYRKKRLTSRA